MKECPNCSMELPDEAHYCPRCMFQYEKQEIQIKDRHRKHIPLLLIGSVLVIGVLCLLRTIFLETTYASCSGSTPASISNFVFLRIFGAFKASPSLSPTLPMKR